MSDADRDTGGDPGAPRAAVIDRIVEGIAVVLVGDDEIQFDVAAHELPDGAAEGSVVVVRPAGDTIEVVAVDEAATDAARQRAAAQRERLRGRSRRFGDRR